MARINRFFSLLAICFIFAGCSRWPWASSSNLKTNSYVIPKDVTTTELTVSRAAFKKRVATEDLRNIRMVPVTRSIRESTGTPEYRLFSISPDSAYAMLGLEERDILVAAQDYAVVDPSSFPLVVKLLENEPEARLLIKRLGKMELVRTVFVD